MEYHNFFFDFASPLAEPEKNKLQVFIMYGFNFNAPFNYSRIVNYRNGVSERDLIKFDYNRGGISTRVGLKFQKEFLSNLFWEINLKQDIKLRRDDKNSPERFPTNRVAIKNHLFAIILDAGIVYRFKNDGPVARWMKKQEPLPRD